jgi:dienelactone hydrolase
MSISFKCPHCGKAFRADEKFAGKNVRCKQCGATTTVPAPSAGGSKAPAEEPETDDPYGLADEPAPLPPRAPVPQDEVPARKVKNKKKSQSSKTSSRPTKGAVWATIAVALLVLRIVMRLNRGDQPHALAEPGAPVPVPPSMVSTAPVGPPAFSPLGTGTVIRPGVRFFEVRASGPTNVATMNMTVWAYLPDGHHEPRSLPCVIIAPAGSITITGMDLGDGDRAEHFPYVTAGYAVLAYSLDGHADNIQQLSDPRLGPACVQFAAARAGLANAQAAIDWLLKNISDVDPDRLYAAGHSSAGTTALLLAENDARIRACSAFAPRSDGEANFNALVRAALRGAIPQVDQIFTTYNPLKHVKDMKCPVLLFQARDDPVIPVSETEAFAAALQGAGKDVTVELVPSGGHYDPMVHQGIPRAISFFSAHGSRASGSP